MQNRKNNYYPQFEKASNTIYANIISDYNGAVTKARDKWTAHQTFHNVNYREQIDAANKQLGKNTSLFHAMKDEYRMDGAREWKDIFNDKFNGLEGDKDALVMDFALYAGTDKFLDYWVAKDKIIEMDGTKPQETINSSMEWKGNKTEFMQLIYSLYHSGYLGNKEGEITKLVNDMAMHWNIELGKNWQSDISKNLTLRNNDYQFEIFDKMKEGLTKHQQERLTKKK